MSDIGHAATNKHLIYYFRPLCITKNLSKRHDIVRIVRTGQNRFIDFTHINLDHFRILCVSIRLKKRWLFQPCLHLADTTFQGVSITQFKGLFHLELRQPLNLQNTSCNNILLSFLFHRQHTPLDGLIRNGIDKITQGNSWLKLT